MGPAIYGVVLGYGLRGEDERRRDWLGRLGELIGTGSDPANCSGRRCSLTPGSPCTRNARPGGDGRARPERRPAAVVRGPHWYSLRPYAWAIAAEVAVVAGLADAESLLEEAAPAGAENYWAGACLARAAGRLHGDQAELERSIAGWERIGARLRACLHAAPAASPPGRRGPGRADPSRLPPAKIICGLARAKAGLVRESSAAASQQRTFPVALGYARTQLASVARQRHPAARWCGR